MQYKISCSYLQLPFSSLFNRHSYQVLIAKKLQFVSAHVFQRRPIFNKAFVHCYSYRTVSLQFVIEIHINISFAIKFPWIWKMYIHIRHGNSLIGNKQSHTPNMNEAIILFSNNNRKSYNTFFLPPLLGNQFTIVSFKCIQQYLTVSSLYVKCYTK